MGDLRIGRIPLESITLERMDYHNNKHIKAIGAMRDRTAVEMCYDVQREIDAQKMGVASFGNHFLVKNNDQYFGYMFISDDYDGERVLSYIVAESVRGKGFGKIMLTSVSKYLFDCCDTNVLKLYINKRNVVGQRLAVGCGFEKTGVSDDTLCGYDRRK